MNTDSNDSATRGKVVTDNDPDASETKDDGSVVKKWSRKQLRAWKADQRRTRRRKRPTRGMTPEQRKEGDRADA